MTLLCSEVTQTVSWCQACCDFICHHSDIILLTQEFKYIRMNVSEQAVKKGASQTVVGLIFGCYAVCNLIGSLILGRYVSMSDCF